MELPEGVELVTEYLTLIQNEVDTDHIKLKIAILIEDLFDVTLSDEDIRRIPVHTNTIETFITEMFSY